MRRRFAALFALVLGLLALGQRREPTAISVPVAPWPGYAYFPLAREKGLDRRHGLDLSTVAFDDPQDIVAAYLNGTVKVAQLTTVEAVQICHARPPRCPLVVLILDESQGGDQVVVRPEVATIERLRGQRVAVVPSSLGPYVLSRALATEGLHLNDVELVPQAPHQMPGSLARGEVDGAALYPPFSEEAVRLGKARVVFDSRRIPGEVFDILVVEPEYFKTNQAAVVNLLKTWQEAHRWARARPQEADRILGKALGLSPQGLQRAEQGLVYEPLERQLPMLAPDGLLERNLTAVRAVQVELGLMDRAAPLPPVTNAPLRRALGGLAGLVQAPGSSEALPK